MTKFEVRAKLYVDSMSRRTSLVIGTFDTLKQAVDFVSNEYVINDESFLELDEEITVVGVEVQGGLVNA